MKKWHYKDSVIEFEDGLMVKINRSDLEIKKKEYWEKLIDVDSDKDKISEERIDTSNIPIGHLKFLDYMTKETRINIEYGKHKGENRELNANEIKTIISTD